MAKQLYNYGLHPQYGRPMTREEYKILSRKHGWEMSVLALEQSQAPIRPGDSWQKTTADRSKVRITAYDPGRQEVSFFRMPYKNGDEPVHVTTSYFRLNFVPKVLEYHDGDKHPLLDSTPPPGFYENYVQNFIAHYNERLNTTKLSDEERMSRLAKFEVKAFHYEGVEGAASAYIKFGLTKNSVIFKQDFLSTHDYPHAKEMACKYLMDEIMLIGLYAETERWINGEISQEYPGAPIKYNPKVDINCLTINEIEDYLKTAKDEKRGN